ncbi:UNVERIFIED_CONTAM: Mannan endo-1,4-beta-mannosidase 2, partial [Sesamum radiatum]
DDAQMTFMRMWMTSYLTDSGNLLKKPMVLTEFGKSSRNPSFSIATRKSFLNAITITFIVSQEVEELDAAWFGNLWMKE